MTEQLIALKYFIIDAALDPFFRAILIGVFIATLAIGFLVVRVARLVRPPKEPLSLKTDLAYTFGIALLLQFLFFWFTSNPHL